MASEANWRRRSKNKPMIKTPKAALQILMVCFAGAPAFAHSPYVRGETPWISPDGRQLAVGMLYGDGIFLADPARPVILDEQRRVLAMGPLKP
jgi:hypothetical protein